jgi:predicted O-linked N-acetylglucosamine transferase (SPINDLY family)
MLKISETKSSSERLSAALGRISASQAVARPQDTLLNMSAVSWQHGRFHEAVMWASAGVSHAPRDPKLHANLASALRDAGEYRQARAAYARALELDPDFAKAASGNLFALLYDDEVTAESVWKSHMAWGREFPSSREPRVAVGDPDVLKVGYLSSDFRVHSVAEFIEPIIGAHTKGVEVHCYSTGTVADQVTTRIRAKAAHWHDVRGMRGDELAKKIESDGINILVDLGGHTHGNSLAALAYWPAPVQVSYLGYPHAVGMAQTKRLGDSWADLGIEEEGLERLSCMWAFQPPWDAVPVPCPSIDRGAVTYGCFRPPVAWNPTMVGIWCELLRQDSRAHLVLKGKGGIDALVTSRVASAFARAGVADRVAMLPMHERHLDHLHALAQVDVCLDTWPWSGTTTTCEALWAGVPVVALAGDVHYRRTSGAILNHAGQGSLAVGTPEEYVAAAIAIGRDVDNRREYRQVARDRMRQSPLMDYQARAVELEAAYRRLWNQAK